MKDYCECLSLLDHLYLLKTAGTCTISVMENDFDGCSQQPDSVQRANASRFRIGGWKKINLKKIDHVRDVVAENKPVIFSVKIDDGFKSIASPFLWVARKGAENADINSRYIISE